MNILLVKCLVFFCYFLAFINTNEAKQADRLRQLIINSRRMPRQGLDNSWSDLMTSARAGLSKVSVINQGGSMETDRIGKLPGQPVGGVAFNQYGGYVTVDATKGRALFYYFVESPRGSSSKPLVLWLNGGPGCSSLGFGAMAELGPFRVNGDGKTLYANPFAWNQVVNVIFLESPVGVGFSYSNTSSDCDQSGDRRTAQDALTFLVNWLERFPQYKDRDFYITGESYAGHYVPQLAKAIIDYNKVMKRTIINLKGIAIGNAYLDGRGDIVDTNTMGQYEFFWTHALISDESWRRILSQCKYPGGKYTKGCNDALDKVDVELGDIDGYNIYAPICRAPSKSSSAGSVYQYDPCGDDQVDTYLNHVDVQKALHANTSMPYKWSACSDYPYKDRAPNMLPIIKQVIDSGVRVWLYSGDIDSVVSVTSTRLSINMLKLPIENPWRPWYTDNEVGGYIEGYQGLTFATVRGAGHEVPLYQPARALTLFTAFVQGKLPPSAEA